jgi:probable HAF family extracellular repeat protein
MPVYNYTTLDDPLATGTTEAWGVNDIDQIVGRYIDATGKFHGFLYSGGRFTTLDDPFASGPVGTTAFGINRGGQIVGYYRDASNHSHGFLYNRNDGTYTTVDDPLATGSTLARGIARHVVCNWFVRTARHAVMVIADCVGDPSISPNYTTHAAAVGQKVRMEVPEQGSYPLLYLMCV